MARALRYDHNKAINGNQKIDGVSEYEELRKTGFDKVVAVARILMHNHNKAINGNQKIDGVSEYEELRKTGFDKAMIMTGALKRNHNKAINGNSQRSHRIYKYKELQKTQLNEEVKEEELTQEEEARQNIIGWWNFNKELKSFIIAIREEWNGANLFIKILMMIVFIALYIFLATIALFNSSIYVIIKFSKFIGNALLGGTCGILSALFWCFYIVSIPIIWGASMVFVIWLFFFLPFSI
ncbi:hypothetical protein LW135_06790 [Helicobacter sp. faydin-H20]|uniref:hypothetical protein n=1 Tax=Helicobacter anatolicus TaxID=2905874 RepID=UPI001E4DF99A|nr:hypothetical protein [Helicobacter anatolicus]MCE3037526.1 hypothetical protein [Helicobacter anatolicus]